MSARSKLRDSVTTLNAVETTGAGAAVDGRSLKRSVWFVKRNGEMSTPTTVLIQVANSASSDDEDWATLATVTASADGTDVVEVDGAWPYLRANVSVQGDGNVTVKYRLQEG